MANYPKKMMDPTEAALSAIQEALNIRDDEDQDQDQAQSEPRARAEGRPEGRPEDRPEGMSDLFAGDPRSRGQSSQAAYQESIDTGAIGTRDLAAQSGRVANDDQQSVGQVLRALQQ